MSAAPDAARPVGWAEVIRRAPLGILLVGGILCFLGFGLALGGGYLAVARSDTGWGAWLAVLVAGPALVYLGVNLLRLTRGSWRTLALLLTFLLASSLVRAATSPEAGLSPFGEIVLEIALLLYLTRPAVRRAFGRG
jgi:hypothetical protein